MSSYRQRIGWMRMGPPKLSLRAYRLLQALKSRRIELGLAQTTVALQIGIHRGRLSDLEHGIHSPTLGTLLRWASAVDFDVCFVRVDNVKTQARSGGPVLKRLRQRRHAKRRSVLHA